jgi:hypothetical protein
MPDWVTGDTIRFAGWLLVSTVLWFMVLKVWMPFAPKVEGQVLHQSRLRLRQKLLLHRTHLYLLSLLLLLGVLPGPRGTTLLPPVAYPLALGVVLIVLGLPVRYVFTDRGLVLSAGVFGAHALFRAWKEFRRYHIRDEAIVLEGRPRRYTSYLIVADQDQQREIRRLLKRHLR